MTFDPSAKLVAYHAALDSHDVQKIRAALSEGVTYESPGLGVLSGRAAVLASIESYFATSPDHKAWDDRVWNVSDRIAACEWHLKATNSKTAQVVERRGKETIVFDAEGLILSVKVDDL